MKEQTAELMDLAQRLANANRKQVATMTIQSLRCVRDCCPDEWDALMNSDAGPLLCTLWDYLKYESRDV